MNILAFLLIGNFIIFVRSLNPRIVGGNDAPIGRYPYQVSIRVKGKHYCGGSIIDKRHILTAAHCLISIDPWEFTVHAGTNFLNMSGVPYKVDKITYHKEYNEEQRIHDIGLIRVGKDIEFTANIQPVTVAREEINFWRYPAIVTGWGRLSASGTIPNALQEIMLSAIPYNICKYRISSVRRTHICTYSAWGRGVCRGDSGGPVVINGVQVGIVSYGYPCALGLPDVHTNVYAYRTWIDA